MAKEKEVLFICLSRGPSLSVPQAITFLPKIPGLFFEPRLSLQSDLVSVLTRRQPSDKL